jgi:hypothetical protein
MSDMGAGALFFLLLFFAIGVALSRWVFRINDIIKRLDKIVVLLTPKDEKAE